MDTQNNEFVFAGSLEQLKAVGRLVLHGHHRPILVIYDRGRVFALDSRCPHMGFPLERGSVDHGILTCHWHHARFDLESGCTFDLWADDVRNWPVEIRNDDVWVRPTFAHANRAAHWHQRLADGLAHDLGLVIAKAVHGQLAADVPRWRCSERRTAMAGAWGLRFLRRLPISCPCCRRSKPLSPCSTARDTWRRTATARRLGGNVRRLQAARTQPRSLAGSARGSAIGVKSNSASGN
jgi:nitrite reductase/ring-hydroxylating ferredoxin subunit